MTPISSPEKLHQHYLSVVSHDLLSPKDKLISVTEIFHLIIEEATNQDYVNFTTLFSRLSYLGTKFNLPRHILSYSHQFRKANESKAINQENIHLYVELGTKVCGLLFASLWKIGQTKDFLLDEAAYEYFKPPVRADIHKVHLIEALVFEVNMEEKTFLFFDDIDAVEPKTGKFDIHDRNEMFTKNFESLVKTFHLPIHVNLIDVDIDSNQVYIPQAIVIHPDYMIDVTSIAECFKDSRAEPFLYLLTKFKPKETSESLMIGNLVNVILDELIGDPNTVFDDGFTKKLFKADPIGFAAMDDHATKKMLQDLRIHFDNLKTSIKQAFGLEGIKIENIYLEPSFYSRDYGTQGRLDVLHLPADRKKTEIIELKSGKTFKPNAYQINESHYIQTLMYDLMITSALGIPNRKNYILYSRYPIPNLRHAPVVRQQQHEALRLRNSIIAIEQKLQSCQTDSTILSYLKESNFPHFKGFTLRDMKTFESIYVSLDPIEKTYFNHFVAFIAREQSLSKTGEDGVYKSSGHASLWLESDEEKRTRFALLSNLTIVENGSHLPEATITFSKAEDDESLVNLRPGDIGVLYPSMDNQPRAVLKSQIFKCSITEIGPQTVSVKLRSKQNNQSIFNQFTTWNIEQDSLDSSFNSMYRSMFAWASSSTDYRKLILGRSMPQGPSMKEIDQSLFDSFITQNQRVILTEALRTKDYYLLWGPPGTGKTSVMLKNMVKYLYQKTEQSILLIAYTNRAVDEICEAIVSIDESFSDRFVRIGSRSGTHEKFAPNLLDHNVGFMQSRQEILDLITRTRIFVSTLSSIISRPDIFAIKNFDTVIIDEASQILEPMLVGFLYRFKRFILIGDHKQLPAVVVQNPLKSRIHDQSLHDIEIYDTRVSLFERMYLQAVHRGDYSRIGILKEQGRMHVDIMNFVNRHFYENQLDIIPDNDRQRESSFFKNHVNPPFHQRMSFVNIEASDSPNWKTSALEADAVVDCIVQLQQIYQDNNMTMHHESIGIITPYRAQIALIRHKLQQSTAATIAPLITIDTVERYQGGARDIIVISFCVNRLSQLDSLISPSLDGTDRKLNVALTRAKQHIVMFGNQEILETDTTYQMLIETCIGT